MKKSKEAKENKMNEEMIDLSNTVIPKTDQMNYDCLVSGPKTITITKVENKGGEQPVIIHYEGEDGRPYKPCLGMRRVLVDAWGKNGAKYIGRKITVFGNPDVKWAGKEQGGIQISHLSHIKKPINFMMTVSRGKRVPHKVGVIETEPLNELKQEVFDSLSKEIADSKTVSELQGVFAKMKAGKFEESELKAKLGISYKSKMEELRNI
jgi:hypothetical protein